MCIHNQLGGNQDIRGWFVGGGEESPSVLPGPAAISAVPLLEICSDRGAIHQIHQIRAESAGRQNLQEEVVVAREIGEAAVDGPTSVTSQALPFQAASLCR